MYFRVECLHFKTFFHFFADLYPQYPLQNPNLYQPQNYMDDNSMPYLYNPVYKPSTEWSPRKTAPAAPAPPLKKTGRKIGNPPRKAYVRPSNLKFGEIKSETEWGHLLCTHHNPQNTRSVVKVDVIIEKAVIEARTETVCADTEDNKPTRLITFTFSDEIKEDFRRMGIPMENRTEPHSF